MKNYMIKRSPDLTNNGVIVKRNVKSKGFSESAINRNPSSNKLAKNDTIYVAETDYGIYAKGTVISKDDILEFKDVDEVLNHIESNNYKDASYWLSLISKLHKAKLRSPKSVLRYQKYNVNLKLLDFAVLFDNGLENLKSRGGQPTILDDELVGKIENPSKKLIKELSEKIPGYLKLSLYSLFNKKANVSTWIDIDHFIPKSVGGPGNIPENLVPVGFGLNRYKSNAIPRGLFKIASKYPETSAYGSKFVDFDEDFIKCNEAIDLARKIVNEIKGANKDIYYKRNFFKKVLAEHHKNYVKIIEGFEF